MTECPHQRNRVRHFIYQVHTLNKNIRTFAITLQDSQALSMTVSQFLIHKCSTLFMSYIISNNSPFTHLRLKSACELTKQITCIELPRGHSNSSIVYQACSLPLFLITAGFCG